jgi:hypothetical protein
MYLHGNSTGTDNDDGRRRRTTTTDDDDGQQKCVCASFILVLVVQIVHTKKPRLTSKQNEAQIYVGTVQGPSP